MCGLACTPSNKNAGENPYSRDVRDGDVSAGDSGRDGLASIELQRAFAAVSVGGRDVNPLLRNERVVHAKYDSILCLVQFHIIVPSPQSIMQCWSESECPHFEEESESFSRMAAKRSFMGMMSCISAYHRD